MNTESSAPGARLDAALVGVATAFRGMTARPDEGNCECHWGSAEELAQLKVPDVELDPDLLRRTWAAPDWDDHASVLRRILPQLSTALVTGQIEPWIGLDEVGLSLAGGAWRQWPSEQAGAVQEFLETWWAQTLTDPQPVRPAYEIFAFCVVASGELNAWLDIWQEVRHPVADRHLTEAVAHWADNLVWHEDLPWDSCATREENQPVLADLAAWLVRHAPARLRAHGAPAELLHQVRLLGVSTPARWDDPYWPRGKLASSGTS